MKTLKHIIVGLALLLTYKATAQTGFNYKALIKDDLGNVLVEQDVTLRFTITAIGFDYYRETHATTTNENGIVIVNIGEGVSNLGTFSFIPWFNYGFSLEVEIDITGGTSFVDMGTTLFKTVPYAKYAERVNISNLNIGVNNLNDGKSDPFGSFQGSSIFLGRVAGNDDDGSDNRNSGLGYKSLYKNTSGERNVAIGHSSLENSIIGSDNVAIGYRAGVNNTGSGNVFIGNRAGGFTSSSSNNKLYINNNISSNPLIYGDFDAGLLQINGDVITGGTLSIQNASDDTSSWRFETRPNGNLSMYRNGDYRGFFSESTGNYSSISDRRLKKNITSFENGTLNKIMQLNPVSYLMKNQTGTKRNLGLISQEVQKIFPSITNYNKEADILTLSYTELIPVLIKAIQEQQEIIETLKLRIEALENN
ncbi:MAG: tail fiber domain-containing protein [Flavobacteriaceae bacterium]|nr:tail fiber domain-containing protein [Flavobacteriaceae bacterium]